MKRYETLLLLRPDLPENEVRAVLERNCQLIERMGGTVDRLDEWGLRELAYPVRKFPRGYYALLEHTSTAEIVRELDRTLKITDEVLRFMTVVRAPVRDRAARRPTAGRTTADSAVEPTTEGTENEQADAPSGATPDPSSAAAADAPGEAEGGLS